MYLLYIILMFIILYFYATIGLKNLSILKVTLKFSYCISTPKQIYF